MDNPEILTTLGTQGMGRRLQKTEGTIKNGQSRDTGWVHKAWDEGYRKLKGQSRMDNPEILTTLGTQGMGRRLQKTEGTIKNGQSRDTDNIGYTRHGTKVTEN